MYIDSSLITCRDAVIVGDLTGKVFSRIFSRVSLVGKKKKENQKKKKEKEKKKEEEEEAEGKEEEGRGRGRNTTIHIREDRKGKPVRIARANFY